MPRNPKKRRSPPKHNNGPGPARGFLEAEYNLNDSTHGARGGDDVSKVVNGHVLLIFLKNNQNYSDTIKEVDEKFGVIISRSNICNLFIKVKHIMPLVSHPVNMEKFKTICGKTFSALCKTTFSPPSPPPSSESLHHVYTQTYKPILTDAQTQTTLDDNRAQHLKSQQMMSPTFIPNLRLFKTTPRRKKLAERCLFLSSSKKKVQNKYLEKIREIKGKIPENCKTIRVLKQKLDRRNKTINLLKIKLSRCELHQCLKERIIMKRKCSRLSNKLKNEQENSKASSQILVKQVREKNEEVQDLQNSLLMLEKSTHQNNENYPTKKDKKTYNEQMRMVVYESITNQVPAHKVSKLIKKMAIQFGINVCDIPNESTVINMVHELGVISDLLVAENVINTNNLTLCFDATTQEGVYTNFILLTSITSTYVVDIDVLPGGTAEDYEIHICESIDHLAKVYTLFNDANFEDVRNDIINKITNTMTDRAAVNHATIQRLCATWNKGLTELFCHLHPLESISTSCRTALKQLEPSSSNESTLFGRDCIAGKIILSFNTLRYKDGKGDPRGFTTFLRRQKLPMGLIPRYRGNRLHIVFHISGILVLHRQRLCEYLKSYATECGGLSSCLLADFSCSLGLAELCVLGMLGKLLTGLWMAKFYSGPSGPISYLDGIVVIKGVLSRVQQCLNHPLSMLTLTNNFFGEPLESSDPIITEIKRVSPNEIPIAEMIKTCLKAIVEVVQRQYGNQFATVVTEELKASTESARTSNIAAEELIGMFNAAKQRAPNASVVFTSCKIKAIKNKVTEILATMEDERRFRLISKAVTLGRIQKMKSRKKMVELMLLLERRSTMKKQNREDKDRRIVEKELRNMPSVKVEDLLLKYPHITNQKASVLADVLGGQIVGKYFCHRWWDTETQDDIIYMGKVEKKHKSKRDTYVVSYWKQTDTYEEAVDYDINKYSMAADVIKGDAEF